MSETDPQATQPLEYVHIAFAKRQRPSRFHLIRETDVSGISGTGTVAAGVIWPDDTVSMRWLTYTASTSVYESIEDVQLIHGHQGATKVHFVGAEDAGVPLFRLVRTRGSHRTDLADGAVWTDGSVSIRWRGEHASTVYWKSLDDARAVHTIDGFVHFEFSPMSAA